MKSTLLTFSLIFFSNILFSQTASFEWAKGIGGKYDDQGEKIKIDSKGNIYTLGTFFDSVDFDPGPGKYYIRGTHNRNTFICKYDPQGNFIWAKAYQSSRIFMNEFKLDNSDNLIIEGYYSGTFDFNLDTNVYNLTALGPQEVFILKLDSAGQFIWVKSFPAKVTTTCFSFATYALNNIYLTGSFVNKIDFDPDTNKTFYITSKGNTNDIFITKLDSLGDLVWAKSIGGNKDDRGRYICVDKNGNSYTIGTFQGTVDFDPDTSAYNKTEQSNNGGDNYILKLD